MTLLTLGYVCLLFCNYGCGKGTLLSLVRAMVTRRFQLPFVWSLMRLRGHEATPFMSRCIMMFTRVKVGTRDGSYESLDTVGLVFLFGVSFHFVGCFWNVRSSAGTLMLPGKAQ